MAPSVRLPCPFGVAYDTINERCDPQNTYASQHMTAYNALRITTGVLGLVAFLACLRKFYLIRSTGGSSIQHRVYLLLLVASLMHVANCVDPYSYASIYPPFLSALFSDICSACLYSILILCAGFYAHLVAPAPDAARADFFIQGFLLCALFLTWVIYVVVHPVYLAIAGTHAGNFLAWYIVMQYSMAPCLLVLVSSAALVFGLQVYHRLKCIHEDNEHAAMIAVARRRADSVKSDTHRHNQPHDPILLREESSNDQHPTDFDRRILWVVVLNELYALVVILLQMWRLIDFVVVDQCSLDRARQCSSRGDCDLPIPFPAVAIVQFSGIALAYWSFRKTRTTAPPPSLARAASLSASLLEPDPSPTCGGGAVSSDEYSNESSLALLLDSKTSLQAAVSA
ncbi:Aste57867_1201 [Aphanomyces stellatus]|uniref:Aste57867_1201 protein n=1 Tax=Aphanomyces stellatus TaxID=120398 RepID=A0A485K5V2_9STRA|nr:hypothetical protein As57867_001200 [Aphanomyces stellatus]VFT78421.1 Aste57867_1201 [Aphanomyces stellatus]